MDLKRHKNFMNEASDNKFHKFMNREQAKYDNNFELAKTRAWTGLLLLTQATKEEMGLTDTIIELAQMLEPVLDLSGHRAKKFAHVMDPNSNVHNAEYEERRFADSIVYVCAPLEYILNWYTEADQEPPFDLGKFNAAYKKLEDIAKENFSKSSI